MLLQSHAKHICRTDSPSKEEWISLVEKAIAEPNLEKVVLARATTLTYENDLDPIEVMNRLQSRATNAHFFCYRLDETRVFLGATPEKLYHRIGRTITTEAIAGTKPSGDSFTEKEIAEQKYVSDFLEDFGKKFCVTFSASKPFTIETSGMLHIKTTFTGTLLPHVTDEMLIEALHPTPAIGGTPRKEALAFIEKYEPFDRGPYASPVGKISEEETELYVAIRSAIVEKNRLTVFAGAGITGDSDPEAEWDELETKIRPFL